GYLYDFQQCRQIPDKTQLCPGNRTLGMYGAVT
ncbi:unnamed protein product, partial [marine sediment metagenome]